VSLFFLDTSALAKRYFLEAGTTWMRNVIAPSMGNQIIIAELALVEFASVVARRERMAAISQQRASNIRSRFVHHTGREYTVILIDSAILSHARRLVRKHPLRALDSIQLACALQSRRVISASIIFLSADNDLLTAATAEGFNVDNPNNYP
jgi:uncharacterized protein